MKLKTAFLAIAFLIAGYMLMDLLESTQRISTKYEQRLNQITGYRG